jgi:histidinol-phosphate aminotransferase
MGLPCNGKAMTAMNSTDQARGRSPAWLKPSVAALPAYRGPQTAAAVARPGAMMRLLHLNESPYPPSPRAIEAFTDATRDLNRYPDIHASALASELSARTGIAVDRIIFGCGSDELIHFLCEIALGPGDELVIPAPSFPRYALSGRILGATAIRARLDANGANDADALAGAIGERTRLLFCCTPNPPSGGMMGEAALDRIVTAVPDSVLLVVDEAYHEFAMHAGGSDILAALRRRRGPWVVLRTFSKAYGLGGARIGYALCGAPEVADALRKVKLQFNVTAPSQAAALAALRDETYLRTTLDAIAVERTRLAAGIAAMGLSPLPSAANFVSVRLAIPAADACEEFRRRGILIRDWRDPDHLNEIRITIGVPEDTDAVLVALREILALKH